jgi:hypothetical protein
LAEELPPTAELVLLRIFAAAFIATQSRKRSEAFLRKVADLLAREGALADVLPMRGDRRAESEARRQALAAFRRDMPAFLASLPPE